MNQTFHFTANFLSLLVVVSVLLCGCGSSSDVNASNPLQDSGGTVTLSGGVVDSNFLGSTVKAFHVQPAGTIGEPRPEAGSYPLPSPEPVASSAPLQSDGRFILNLPDDRPVLLIVERGASGSSSEALQAAVPNPSEGPVLITALTLQSARLALAQVRSGKDVTIAFREADASLAAFYKMESVLRPTDSSDRFDYALLLTTLRSLAEELSLDYASLVDALARDLVDGTFDGREGNREIVLPRGVQAQEVPANPTTEVMLASLLNQLADKLEQNAKQQDENMKQLETRLASHVAPIEAELDTVREPSSELLNSLSQSTKSVSSPPSAYSSPYSVNFTCTLEQLTTDFDESPRSQIEEESFQPPFADWYKKDKYPESQRPWGPLARVYPAPTVPAGCDPLVWRRERVVASALRRVGTHYQHHHIPDWNPAPHNWPDWKKVSLGHNGPGIDCSNFSSWNYNFGLGIKLETAVSTQASTLTFQEPGGGATQIQVVSQVPNSDPIDYQELIKTLETGDLLYIRGMSADKPGENISHVIMWVGDIGVNPEGIPLIIDSHDNQPPVLDANGVTIPAGVHLRPFREKSWYHTAFDHAHRLVR